MNDPKPNQMTVTRRHLNIRTQASLVSLYPSKNRTPVSHLELARRKLIIHERHRIHFLGLSDIVFCQAENNYTRIFTCGGNTLLSSKCLKDIESRIQKCIGASMFFRCHASYLVNMSLVSSATKTRTWELQVSGHTIPVARSRTAAFKDLLNQSEV